jgi:hypothetical protein
LDTGKRKITELSAGERDQGKATAVTSAKALIRLATGTTSWEEIRRVIESFLESKKRNVSILKVLF